MENAEFLRFAYHWQFRVRACRPYRAKTKGKVERAIRYVRDNFVYGREFISDDDLDAQLSVWLREVANVRRHGTTNERPSERFERDEQAALNPLAERPYSSLVLPRPARVGTRASAVTLVSVPVERRSLQLCQWQSKTAHFWQPKIAHFCG